MTFVVQYCVRPSTDDLHYDRPSLHADKVYPSFLSTSPTLPRVTRAQIVYPQGSWYETGIELPRQKVGSRTSNELWRVTTLEVFSRTIHLLILYRSSSSGPWTKPRYHLGLRNYTHISKVAWEWIWKTHETAIFSEYRLVLRVQRMYSNHLYTIVLTTDKCYIPR